MAATGKSAKSKRKLERRAKIAHNKVQSGVSGPKKRTVEDWKNRQSVSTQARKSAARTHKTKEKAGIVKRNRGEAPRLGIGSRRGSGQILTPEERGNKKATKRNKKK